MHRILFVDDEPAIPRSLQRMVRSYSVEAETEGVHSASEALERVRKGDIDVVVSDIRMPGMDGIELLTRLKADPLTQQIPVIMLTGDGDASVKNLALELGAAEFVNKPADSTELCARLRNVMRLKSFQDQLVHQNEILTAQIIQAQRMELAGILASEVAHDLNNILSAIVGNAELALFKARDRDINPDIQKVIMAAQHAARLVRQIRDLGRRPSEEVVTSDPADVIDSCLDLLRIVIPDGVSVSWSKPAFSGRVPVAPTALHQVIMNLVINAVHATGDAGRLAVELTMRDVEPEEVAEQGAGPGKYAVVSISDSGHGIDEAVLPHIFEPFFTTKGEGVGTGIGLSVVDRLTRAGGGFVRVESKPGVGTTFSVYLPFTEESVSVESPESQAATL